MELLKDLDWKSGVGRVSTATHWRIMLCVGAGAVVSTFAWHAAYPDAFWFLILWCGGTTGFAAGLVPGALWQLSDRARHSSTSGRLLISAALGWSFFSAMSLIVLRPAFQAQELELARFHAISSSSISAIDVTVNRQKRYTIDDVAGLASFSNAAKSATLFSPSHEGSSGAVDIVIHFSDHSVLGYSGRLPERHPDDVSVGVPMAEILLPGLRDWLR